MKPTKTHGINVHRTQTLMFRILGVNIRFKMVYNCSSDADLEFFFLKRNRVMETRIVGAIKCGKFGCLFT